MADHELDILIRAVADDLRAYDTAIAKNQTLNASTAESAAASRAASVEMAGLSSSVQLASGKHAEHAVKANEAAAAERNLTRDAREAAKASGELGAKGGELVQRFSAVAGVMGQGGAMGIALGAAIVGLGAVAEGAKRVDETYQEIQHSEQNLRQATDATNASYEYLSSSFDKFIDQNKQYVSNQNEARDALAGFVRAGFDADTSMKALGVTIDLAGIKNEDLNTAGLQVLKMMEGQGRVAKELGIDIKALTNSDDNAVKAHKDLEAANKEVEKAQTALTTATRLYKEEQDALAPKHKLTQHDLDVLQDKANNVKTAQDNLTKATQDQKVAQDGANGSMSTAAQVLDQLSVKTDKGRQSVTDHDKSVNLLRQDWDKFAHDTGPAVDYMFQVLMGTLAAVVEVLDGIAHAAQDAWYWIEQTVNHPGASAGQGIGRARQHGGPVYPGGVYTVGEAGPETLMMGGSGGYVVPGGGGGGSVDDTNDLLGQVVALLSQVVHNTKGPTFSTAAYGRR